MPSAVFYGLPHSESEVYYGNVIVIEFQPLGTLQFVGYLMIQVGCVQRQRNTPVFT